MPHFLLNQTTNFNKANTKCRSTIPCESACLVSSQTDDKWEQGDGKVYCVPLRPDSTLEVVGVAMKEAEAVAWIMSGTLPDASLKDMLK